MHQRVAVGDDLDACGDEGVDDLSDRLLVAGNGARRKDDGVAGAQFRGRVFALGHARQRGAGFALTAGGERQGLVPGQAAESVHPEQRREAVEHVKLAGDRDDTLHRPAQDADLTPGANPASAAARSRATLEAKVVTTTLPFALPIRSFRVAATSRSDGLSPSLRTLVESHTSPNTPSSPSASRRSSSVVRAEHRGRVDLPVAGMDDDSGRRPDRQQRTLRDRMGDRDEFDVERPDRHTTARPDDLDWHLRRARLAKAARLREARGEGRGVDLHA